MNKEEAKQKVAELVERFEEIIKSGQFKKYSEEDTKKDFILPLFEILGWDVYNLHNKEVIAEENISGNRVDYGFYLNGRPQFYLEAKAIKADLNKEEFANQAIRYSWNRGVTWAILTDFENIKIFNAQNIDDIYYHKLFKDIHYKYFTEKFDEIWSLSKESFKNDELDKEAEKYGKKIQKVSVTKKLYEDLNEARESLTHNLIAWNPDLRQNPHLVDEGVQKILDRIIFIRVAEDRGIEPPTLRPLVREWQTTKAKTGKLLYQSMISKFKEFDDIYNSHIFSPHPSDKWEEHSNIVGDIIEKLYGKKDYYEYDFKAMSTDILGTVYEQYLGHKLSKAFEKDLFGNSDIELEKDLKKRKQHGIYYTPAFVVDYIVKNALGPVLDSCKSVADLKKIKVLDPACGSGSFLIKAFDLIYKKYEEFGSSGGQYVKLQILNENLYGVDLDEQAIEIARLNLLVASLEKREKLPNLMNIKNANSLTSNWKDLFPKVFEQDGFDVIIGNPPYIKEFVNKSAFNDLHDNPYYQGKMDIWTMFACISIDLLKDNGILGFIASNNWVTNAGASIMRDKILKDGELKTFIDFGDYKVFEDAGIQTMIFVFEKKKSKEKYIVDYLRIDDKNITEEKLVGKLLEEKTKIEIEPKKLINKNITFSNSESSSIFDKLESKRNFELTEKEVGQGIVSPQEYVINKHLLSLQDVNVGDGVFVLKTDEISNMKLIEKEKNIIKPFYETSQISRYYANKNNNLWIIYSDKEVNKNIDKYPNIKKHLEKYKKIITSDFGPFGLHRAREEKLFLGPSVFSIRKTAKPQFSFVDFPCYVSQTYFIISTNRVDLKYLTGILNSNLIYFWLKKRGKLQGDLFQIDKGPLLEIPICIGSEDKQQIVIDLVDKITSLNKKLHKLPENSNEWIKTKEEIEKIDHKIDEEVYKIYGLTEEEIKIIEGKI